MGSPHVSWDAALSLYLTVGKTRLLRSFVHFQPSPLILIYVFFVSVLFIFPFLPHLSWHRYLDKLESCATHSKDCLHWNIWVGEEHIDWVDAHRFFCMYIKSWFHQEQESVICSKLLIVPVFPVIILLWNLWALISKDLLIMKMFCVRVTSCGAQSGIRRCLIGKNFNARTSQGDLKLQFLLAPNIKQVPWQQAVLPSWWITLFRESELVIIWHINSKTLLCLHLQSHNSFCCAQVRVHNFWFSPKSRSVFNHQVLRQLCA